MASSEDSSRAQSTGGKPPETKPDAAQPDAAQDDRRSQSRTETVLSEIEDATYKVLRKHEDKKAK